MLIAAATGNNAKVFRLNSGFLQPGKDADILLFDAALAGSKKTALESLKNGDVTSAVGCFTVGVPRYIGRSRCTPPPARYPKIIKNKIVNDFVAPVMLV
jgi:enamidase